jgi:hypothetical protein
MLFLWSSQVRSVQANGVGSVGCLSRGPALLVQLIGSLEVQTADQAETMKKWAGRLRELTDANMWSFSAKCCAYAQ